MTKHSALDYASRKEPPSANPTAMFFLFLPTAITVAWNMIVRASIAVISARTHADFYGGGFMLPFIFLLPLSFICLIFILIDVFSKKNGFIAALRGLAWNILLIVIFVIIVHFIPK